MLRKDGLCLVSLCVICLYVSPSSTLIIRVFVRDPPFRCCLQQTKANGRCQGGSRWFRRSQVSNRTWHRASRFQRGSPGQQDVSTNRARMDRDAPRTLNLLCLLCFRHSLTWAKAGREADSKIAKSKGNKRQAPSAAEEEDDEHEIQFHEINEHNHDEEGRDDQPDAKDTKAHDDDSDKQSAKKGTKHKNQAEKSLFSSSSKADNNEGSETKRAKSSRR